MGFFSINMLFGAIYVQTIGIYHQMHSSDFEIFPENRGPWCIVNQILKDLGIHLSKSTQKMVGPNLKNLRWEAQSRWSNKLENIWNIMYGMITNLVLGLPRAKQIGLEHGKK